MLTPFMFFWSKILPISYENYLSETEILEALRQKINTVITEIEKIESFLSDDLTAAIDEVVKKAVADLQNEIDELDGKYKEQLALIEGIQKELADHKEELDDVDFQLNDLYQKFAAADIEIDKLKNRIESTYNILNQRINFAIEKAEKDLAVAKSGWSDTLSKMYRNIIRYINDYFKLLSNEAIYVKSPITANCVTLQFALEELAQVYSHGLTARQYRLLNLTALEYREMYLTAEQYRLYGISNGDVEGNPEPQNCYDLFGVRTPEPMSSVYAVFGDGITADMGGLNVTAEQYREVSNATSAGELDRWGRYILTNQYASVFKDTVSIKSLEHTFTTNDMTYAFSLSMDEDSGIVDTVSILTQKSAEKTQLTEIVHPVMEYTIDDVTYVLNDIKNIIVTLQNITYVNGVIMARYHISHDMISVNPDDPSDTITTPVVMTVRGITSTK